MIKIIVMMIMLQFLKSVLQLIYS